MKCFDGGATFAWLRFSRLDFLATNKMDEMTKGPPNSADKNKCVIKIVCSFYCL